MGSTGRSERGAGSVFYDKRSKRWVVMVSLPRTGDGKRRRSKRTFRTKSEAMVFLAGGDAAQSEPVDVTVGVLLDGWQEWVRRRAEANQLAPNTVAGYGYVTAHVRTAFGACLAAEVTVDDVERFLTVQSRVHSGRYVVLQRNVLDQAYRQDRVQIRWRL